MRELGEIRHMSIYVKTLGSLEVRRDGGTLKLPVKAQILVAAVADAAGKPIDKAWLASLLWPRSSERSAAHSLNQTLSALRHSSNLSCRISGGSLLVSTEVHSDLLELKRRLQRNDVHGAAALYEGRFLDTVQDFGSEEFDDWRDGINAYLVGVLRTRLKDSTTAAHNVRDASLVRSFATEGVRLFPEDAEFHHSLIEAELAFGLISEARQHFYDLKARQAAGLTDVISIEWKNFEEKAEILNQGIKERLFVGRSDELATAGDAWRNCLRGRTQLMIVSGAPGIGKSTFCERFITTTNAHLVRAPGHKGEKHVGFNVLATALHECFARSPSAIALQPPLRGALLEVFPELTDDAGGVPPAPLLYEASQRRVFEAAAAVFKCLAAERPVILYLDDIQWADDATLTWLNYFTRRFRSERVLVLATLRTPIPQRPLVQALCNSDYTVGIQLSELPPNEIVRLVKAHRPELASEEALRSLMRQTGGHPLLVWAVVQSARTVANRIVGLDNLLDELRALGALTRTTVDMLAIVAAPMPVALIADILHVDPLRMINVTEQLTPFCEATPRGELRFKHDLVREACYATLTPERCRLLHLRLAQYYERDGGQSGMIANHYWHADRKSRAARFALEAAAGSELRHALSEAEHFYRMAIESLSSKDDGRRVKERLADMLFRAGVHADAAPLLKEIAETYANDTQAQLNWQWRYLDSCLNARLLSPCALKQAAEDLRAASRSCNNDDAYLAALRILVVLPNVTNEQYDTSAVLAELIQLSEACPISRVGIGALRMAGAAKTAEDAFGAVQLLRVAATWAERLHELDLRIATLRSLGVAMYEAGMFDEAYKAFCQGLAVIEEHGAMFYNVQLAEPIASLLLEIDKVEEARKWLAVSNEASAVSSLSTRANAAILELHCGNYDECLKKCDEFFEVRPDGAWHEIPLRGVRGLALLEIGRLKEAKEEGKRVEELLRTRVCGFGDVSFGLLLLARLASFLGNHDKVLSLVGSWQDAFKNRDYVCAQRLRLAFAEALSTRDSAAAIAICGEVIQLAQQKGLAPLVRLGKSIQRRVTRQTAATGLAAQYRKSARNY